MTDMPASSGGVRALRVVDERLGNLPAPRTSFIGRTDDIAALAGLVSNAPGSTNSTVAARSRAWHIVYMV